MGWTDEEPYFSQIEDRAAELVEAGENAATAWNIAYEECVDSMNEYADQEREREELS